MSNYEFHLPQPIEPLFEVGWHSPGNDFVTHRKKMRHNRETENINLTLNDMQAEIFVPISAFAMVLGIVYLSYRKKERMALIQSGRDSSIFGEDKQCYSTLKWGLLLFGVGLGLLIAEALAKYDILSPEVAYFSMAFIFGGAALIVDFLIEKVRSHSNINLKGPDEDKA